MSEMEHLYLLNAKLLVLKRKSSRKETEHATT
jgi:hypothetical protein